MAYEGHGACSSLRDLTLPVWYRTAQTSLGIIRAMAIQSALSGDTSGRSHAARPRVTRCPVCHATRFNPRFTIKGMAIEACSGCRLIVQNPQPSDEQLAAIYGSNYFIGSSEKGSLGAQFDLVK